MSKICYYIHQITVQIPCLHPTLFPNMVSIGMPYTSSDQNKTWFTSSPQLIDIDSSTNINLLVCLEKKATKNIGNWKVYIQSF